MQGTQKTHPWVRRDAFDEEPTDATSRIESGVAGAIDLDGRRFAPTSVTGTVVHVYPEARAYEVQFFKPFHTVATVEASAIRE
jgi:hypothetical protein